MVDGALNTKVTSVSHNFVAADVGTRLQISNAPGGAWTAGFYTILSVAANAATLNSSPAAISSTGGVWAEVGLEYSNQNSPQVAIDNSTITTSIAANVITFTGYTPSAKDIGNNVQMLTGTNVTAGFYQITAFTASTWTVTGAATLPTSGTTTNATGNMGGALLTLGKLSGAMLASNVAYGTGAFTSAATVTFAQTVATPAPTTPLTRLIGYGAARGDATHATLTLSTNTGLTGLSCTGSSFSVEQVDVNCASLGTSTGIAIAGQSRAERCLVSNFTTAGIALSGTTQALISECEVTGGTAAATAAINVTNAVGQVHACYVHDNVCPGIFAGTATLVMRNLVVNNSGAASDGIKIVTGLVIGNTCHNNGRHGIRLSGASFALNPQIIKNNLLTNNGGFGMTNTSSAVPADADIDGNVYGGGASANTSGTRGSLDSTAGVFGVNAYLTKNDVILSGSPYVGPTSGSTANFGLNNVAGAGAACRAVALPKSWPSNTGTTSSPDMGAVQSAGKGGAGIIYAV